MKKGIIVLLITVLVAGMAFASSSLTGYVFTDFSAGLDKDSFIGFSNANLLKFNFDLMEPISTSLTGEGNIYIDAAASANFYIKRSWGGSSSSESLQFGNLNGVVKISKANITNGEWFIGLMGVNSFATYAANTLDFDASGYGVVLNNSKYRKAPAGINFGYKNFVASFGFIKNSEETIGSTESEGLFTRIYASLEAKEVELVEGMKLSAYGAYNHYGYSPETEPDKYFGSDLIAASAKFDYASDKLSVLVAGDTVFAKINDGADEHQDKKIVLSGAQAQLAVSYDPVSVNAYYVYGDLSTATSYGYKGLSAIGYVGGNLNGKLTTESSDSTNGYHYIHAVADVALDSVAPYVGLFANVKKGDYALKPYVGVEVPVDAFTVGAEGYFLFDSVENKNGFGGSVSASYALDFGTFTAACDLGFAQGTEKYAISSIAPSVEFASDTLVDGVTLTLAWSDAEFIGEKSNGIISLSAEVIF